LQTQTLNIRQGAWRGKVQTEKNTASENTLPIPAVLDGWFHEYLKNVEAEPTRLAVL